MTTDATRCLVFPHEEADGPWNMARDEMLLELVAADPSVVACRTYGWSVPTLSLGYFQSIATVEGDPRWAGKPLVRRPTGGGAIWHDRELTYAVVVPRDHRFYRRNVELYQHIHAQISQWLNKCGVAAVRRGEAGAAEATAAEPRPLLCFADRDAEDLVSGGTKIVGSAQRRRAGGLLQHGSILLATSAVTPELPGAFDREPDRPTLVEGLRARIAASLGRNVETPAWSLDHDRRTQELARTIYRDPAWTHRR